MKSKQLAQKSIKLFKKKRKEVVEKVKKTKGRLTSLYKSKNYGRKSKKDPTLWKKNLKSINDT